MDHDVSVEQLRGSVAHHRPRITDPAPWPTGLAGGAGAVAGACQACWASRGLTVEAPGSPTP